MGYDISWALLGDEPLSDGEVAALHCHVARWCRTINGYDLGVAAGAPAGRVLAWASLRPTPWDPDEPSHGGYSEEIFDEVLAALGELRAVVPRAELAIDDDFFTFVWDGGGFSPRPHQGQVPWGELGDGWRWLAGTEAPVEDDVTAPADEAAAIAELLGDGLDAARAKALIEQLGESTSTASTLALGARLAADRVAVPPWLDALDTGLFLRPRPALWPSLALAVDDGHDLLMTLVETASADAAGWLLDGRGARARAAAVAILGKAFGAAAGEALDGLDPAAAGDAALAAALAVARATRAMVARYGNPTEDRPVRAPEVRRALDAVAAAIAAAGWRDRVDGEGAELLDALEAGEVAWVEVIAAGLDELRMQLAGARDGEPLLDAAGRAALEAMERDLVARAEAMRARLPAPPARAAAPAPAAAPEPPAAPAPPPPPPPRAEADLARWLALALAVVAERRTPAAAERAALGLREPERASPLGWRDAIRDDLLRREADLDRAATYLVEHLHALAGNMDVRHLARDVLAAAPPTPARAALAARRWVEAVELGASRFDDACDYLGALAAEAPVFDLAVEALRAPAWGKAQDVTRGAIKLLALARGRAADATAVLVARAGRDRGAREAPWRGEVHRALCKLDQPAAVPTALLELAAGALDEATELLRLVVRHDPSGLDRVVAAIDVPRLGRWALSAVPGPGDDARGDRLRAALLEHPSWQVRLKVVDQIWRREDRAGPECAVWATIDAGEASVEPRDRQKVVDAHGLAAAGPIDWAAEARARGFDRTLAPLPPAVDAMASTCADLRRWAIELVDERRRPDDAPALVLADELDQALAAGGAPRTRPRWAAWRELVPDLPLDGAGRGAWARARPDRIPGPLQPVAARGAAEVARGFPPPHLPLASDERADLERRERALAAAGDRLLGLA